MVSAYPAIKEMTYIMEAKKHSRLKLEGATCQSSQTYALTSKEEPEYRSKYTSDVETPFPLWISFTVTRQIRDVRQGYQLADPM